MLPPAPMLRSSILHHSSIELVADHCCADEIPATSSAEHLSWPVVDIPTRLVGLPTQSHNKNLTIRMDTWTAHALKVHRLYAPPGNLPPELPPATPAPLVCDQRNSAEHINDIRSYVLTRPTPSAQGGGSGAGTSSSGAVPLQVHRGAGTDNRDGGGAGMPGGLPRSLAAPG